MYVYLQLVVISDNNSNKSAEISSLSRLTKIKGEKINNTN